MFDKTTLYPDAISTLVKLRNNQVRLALVTNGTSIAQREKIRKLNTLLYSRCIGVNNALNRHIFCLKFLFGTPRNKKH